MITHALPGYWTIAEIAALFPGRSEVRPVHAGTVRRWISHGLKGRRLRAYCVQRVLLVADADLRDFVQHFGLDPQETL